MRLSRAVRLLGGTGFPNDEQGGQEGTPFLKVSDLDSHGPDAAVVSAANYITDEQVRRLGATVAPAGSVLMPKVGAAMRGTHRRVRIGVDAAFDNNIVALVPREVDSRYLTYWARQVPIEPLIQPGAVASLDMTAFRSLSLPVVDLADQRRVADFLDRECTAIMQALTLRNEQLALLDEELASYASSHLISPEDPWVPLKAVAGFREGPGIMAVDFRDEGTPLLRLRNLVDGTVSLEGCGYLDPAMADAKWGHFRVVPGELLVSGSATSGLPVLVPEEAAGAIPYTGLIRVWQRDDRLDRDFLRCFLASSRFATQVDRLKTGVAIQHWGPSHLRQVKIPLPALEAQRARSRSILARVEQQRRLAGSIKLSAASLIEYRDALISEAVGGQLTANLRLDRESNNIVTVHKGNRPEVLA